MALWCKFNFQPFSWVSALHFGTILSTKVWASFAYFHKNFPPHITWHIWLYLTAIALAVTSVIFGCQCFTQCAKFWRTWTVCTPKAATGSNIKPKPHAFATDTTLKIIIFCQCNKCSSNQFTFLREAGCVWSTCQWKRYERLIKNLPKKVNWQSKNK